MSQSGGKVLKVKKDWDAFPKHLINSKQLEKFGVSWFMNDEIDKYTTLPSNSYIMNLSYMGTEGTHWVLFIVSEKNGKLFYLNPFGDHYNYKVPESIRRLAKRMGLNVVEWKYSIQPKKSNLCGYITLYLAKKYQKILKLYGKLSKDEFMYIANKYFSKHPDSKKIVKILKWAYNNKLFSR